MPTSRHPLPLALLALSVCTPAALWAQSPPLGGMVTGQDIDRMLEIVAAYGPAERRMDEEHGRAWIHAETDGIFYAIDPRDCREGQNCTSLHLRAWWTSEGAHTVEAMNRWNREHRFSAAYLDANGNATISYDINLTGGVTAVNFDDTVQWWLAVLGDFRDRVIEPGYAEADGGEPVMPPSSIDPPPVLSK